MKPAAILTTLSAITVTAATILGTGSFRESDAALPVAKPALASSNMSSSPLAVRMADSATTKTAGGTGLFFTAIGSDANGADNSFIQPQNQALSGGGRDQTQQFTDLLVAAPWEPSILVGRLGDDILVGGNSVDFIVGGPEHFNPSNRDKAFGFGGDDVFIWSPGDGSDRFDGGDGLDTVIFGLVGEDDGSGSPVFGVSNDQQAGDVFFDFFGFPTVDVANSPGFCNVIDPSTSANAGSELASIDTNRLVQFFIRGINQAFVNGTQNTDNGLRVTLSLKSVEFLICTSQAGGSVEAFDLRTSPPTSIPLSAVPFPAQFVVQ